MNWILVTSTVLLLGVATWIYNRLIRNRNLVDEAWAGIDVQLQKRFELVPNLVQTVKGYTAHESTVFEKVARLRTMGHAPVEARAKQETALSRSLGRLFAVAEGYPDLMASEGFRQLHNSMVEIEDHLQYARRYYNGAVRNNNNLVESFPSNILARIFSFKQAEFFEDYDELYWNVTGNGWMFQIDNASARIELPASIATNDLRMAFYTGAQGSLEKNANYRVVSERVIEFQTTHGLLPFEGLTIAVGWPKGIVQEPTSRQKISYFIHDNGSALVLLIGLLLPLGWYLWAWNRHGRDPLKGIIIPRFEPPKGLTPAGCSYIHKMSFNKQAFSAAVVSLGVKGCIEIHELEDGFLLRLKESPARSTPSKGEKSVLAALFSADTTEVELENENYEVFMQASSALKKALKNEHLGHVFNLNAIYALPALMINVLASVHRRHPVWRRSHLGRICHLFSSNAFDIFIFATGTNTCRSAHHG